VSLLRKSARNFAAQTASFAVSMLDRIVLTGALVRIWGIDTFSDWTTIAAAASMLVMTEFGFQTYLGNSLVKAQARGHDRAFQRILEYGLYYYFCFFLILLGLVSAAAVTLNLSGLLKLHHHDIDLAVVVMCVYQLVRIGRSGLTQVLRGKGEYHRMIMTDVRAVGVSTVLVLIGVWLGAGPLLVALLYLASELVMGTGWNFVMVRTRYPKIKLRMRRAPRRAIVSAARELRWYSTFQFNAYVMAGFPVLAIAWLGMSGVGLASFAIQRTLVNFSRTIAATFSAAVGVELATLDRNRDSGQLVTGLIAIAMLNVALIGLTTVGLLFFGKAVIGVWTGRSELGSLVTLGLLLVPIIMIAPMSAMAMVTIYSGVPKPQAIGTGVQLLISVPLCVIFGRLFGIPGVAAGLAIGEVIGIGVVLPALSVHQFHVPVRRLLSKSASYFLLTVAWASGSAIAVTAVIRPSTTLTTLASLAIWGIVAGGPVFLAALPPRQRTRILSFAGQLRYRGAR
jgi:O-antigen/teichoic acid export membrane protein